MLTAKPCWSISTWSTLQASEVSSLIVNAAHLKELRSSSIAEQKKIKTSKDGDFWRLLVPGNYTIRVSKRKYRNINMRVTVNPDQATVLNITLTRKRSFSSFGKGRMSANLTQALDDGPAANLSFHPIVRSHDKLRLSMKNSKGTASRLKNLFCDYRFISCLIIFCLSRLGWDHNCKRLHYLVNTVLKIYIWN